MADMGIEVEVYNDSNPFTKLSVLHTRREPTILREIRAVGAGSFVISKNDPKLIKNPSLLKYRNFVRIRINGEVRGGFIIKTKKHVIVGEGEAAEEAWTVSGEGLLSWGQDATVHPPGGLTLTSRENRYFNFASEQGAWYNPAQWSPAVVSWNWNQPGNWYATAPAEWPDAPTAKWIWDRGNASYQIPQGYVYFRFEINISDPGQHSLFFAVDDAAELFIDGDLVHTTAEHAWQETSRQDFEFETGWHVIALKCYNYRPDGPGGLLAALYKVGDASSPTAARLLAVSDSSWKICAYPAVEPGWSIGHILNQLLDEAEDRGVRFAKNWTRTFTNTHDSAGVPWGDPISISFGISTNYSEVFEALEEAGCDIFLDPDTLELSVWKKRGVDRSAENTTVKPVTLNVGHNLLTADETGQADIVNSLLLHTKEGWYKKTSPNAASQAEYGVLEGQVSTNLTAASAEGLVTELFDQKSMPEKTATFMLIPVPGAVPFVDFEEGDYLSAPGEVPDILEKRRVMSISATERENGDPAFAIEFDTIFKDRQESLEKYLSRQSNSSALSTNFTSTTGTPSTVTQGSPPAGLPVATPEAPTGLQLSSVGRWTDSGTAVSDFGFQWSPVLAAGTRPLSDIEKYEVWTKPTSEEAWSLATVVFDTFAFLSNFTSGESWDFRVRAYSRTAGYGYFSNVITLVADLPVVPLDQPSQPTLVSELGAVAIRWDGLLGGAPAPSRYKYMEIQRATTQNGTYSLVGSFVTGSGLDATGVVGTTYWYRLVPVDFLGVKGAASLPRSIAVAGVSTSELDAALNDSINGARARADEAWDKAVEALGDAALAVVSLITEYAVNSSENTAPTTGWSTTAPARTPGTFVWQRTKTTYGNDNVVTSSPALLTGNTGAAGNGIASTMVTYQTGTSGTSAPTGTWTTSIPAVAPGQFLWTRTVTTLNDNTTTTGYSVALAGANGTNGRGISATDVTYQAAASGTAAPTGAWSTSVPALTPGQYIWTRTVITYTDATTTTTYSVGQAGATGTSATSADIGNEAVVIPTNAAGATLAASTITIPFTGFVGSSRAIATVAVSGLPTGITVQSNTAGTASAAGSLVLAVASGATLGNVATGTITLTITVNGISFVRLFTWTKGATGAQGNSGKGISNVTTYYQLVATGASAPAAPTTNPPPAGWSATEPAWVSNTELYRADLYVFTDATFGWSSVSKVTAYTAATQAISVANLADAAAKGMVKAQSADPGHQVGRIWLQLDSAGKVVGIKISNGTSWASYALMADQILVPSSVGDVSIADGSIRAVKLLLANLDNQLDNPNFRDNTFTGWTRTGDLDGWDTPLSEAGAVNRYLRRTVGATAESVGQLTNTFRVEVRPQNRLRIDALSFCTGIAPGAWTEQRRNFFADPLGTNPSDTTIWGAPLLGDYSSLTNMPGTTPTAVRWTRTAAGATAAVRLVLGATIPRNQVRLRMRVRSSEALTGVAVLARPDIASATNQVSIASNLTIPAGISEFDVVGSAGTFTGTAASGIVLTTSAGAIGATLDITNISVEANATATGSVFSGATSFTGDLEQYIWVGTPNASQSVYQTRVAPSSIGVQFYDGSGAPLAYVPAVLSSTGTWTAITREFEVPTGAYFASLRIEDAGVANSTLRLANLQFRLMGAGQLLVDGDVQARHVGTEELTSRHIKSFSIQVDRLEPTVGSTINLDGNTSINALKTTSSAQQDALTSQQQRLDGVSSAAEQAQQDASAANAAAAGLAVRANDLQAGIRTVQDTVADLGRTYRFTAQGAFVGAPGSPYEFVIQNTGAEIRYNGAPVSSWDSNTMVVNSFVGTEVVLGNHKLEKDVATGGTVVRKIVSN